jgi:cytochrome c biogenesis protein CcdA
VSADTGMELIWFAMAFTLVLSGFLARRIPMATTLRMALAWVGIFAVVFLVIWGWQFVR